MIGFPGHFFPQYSIPQLLRELLAESTRFDLKSEPVTIMGFRYICVYSANRNTDGKLAEFVRYWNESH